MRLTLVLLGIVALQDACADVLTIAVASNFRSAAEEIAEQFAEDTGHTTRISSASTGKLYAQISNGAPFDILLAADRKHPLLLENVGLGIADTRMTYAVGALVLWSRDTRFAGDCRAALDDLGELRLAIANPMTAPYGQAATQFLQAEGLLDRAEPRLVYGENIAQALQFVATGNAQLGLVAKSQALDVRLPAATCSWSVPIDMHDALEQQAVLLRRAANNTAAQEFIAYLGGDKARSIVARFGYGTPE